MTKRTRQPRPPSRSTLRAASQARRVQEAAPGWSSVRLKLSAPARNIADQVALTGLSLRDLMALEMGEHETIRLMLATEESTRVKATLIAAMVQCRKAMRGLVIAGGAGVSLGDSPVVVPEGMSSEAFAAIKAALVDEPDEIMS